MSTLRAQNIGPPGAGATTDVVKGAVKAWGTINTTTTPASFRTSFGASSLTDVGVGSFRPNFSAPMQAAEYAVNANIGSAAGGTAAGSSSSANYCDLNCVNTTWTIADVTGFLSFSVKGILA